MLLSCPVCATAFRVPPDAIGAGGRTVRCSHCGEQWTATPADLRIEVAEPAPALSAATPARPDRVDPPALPPEPKHPEQKSPEPKRPEPQPPAQKLPEPQPPGPQPPDPAVRAIDAAPALVPDLEPPEPDPADPPEAEPVDAPAAEHHPDIETLARRGSPSAAARARRRGPPPLTIALRLAAAGLAGLLLLVVSMRVELVRFQPGFAGLFAAIGMPVNLRGFELHEIRTSREVKDGVPVLVIEGYVYNPGPKARDVPKLRLAVLAAAGRELYAWTAAPVMPMLSAGEGFAFRSRLASPPQEGREVLVRFLHRRDLASQPLP